MTTTTLKITTAMTPASLMLKLEGRLAGPSVAELERAWTGVVGLLDSKKVTVDVCDLTFVDAPGRKLLHCIHRDSNAEFVADGPLTKYFAAEACGEIRY
ncbi:MAG: hypothetical protein JO041_05775 [Acidobacteria bacterium]|nr:hypothetical protein [Acidobacteriota bacterium]